MEVHSLTTAPIGAEERPSSSRFFSLRWKLVVILLALSLALSGMFAIVFHRYLLARFDDSRFAALNQYTNQVNGLIRLQRQHLEQVAMMLPVLSRIRTPLGKSDLAALTHRFDEFWLTFQLDLGLEEVRYFSPNGQELAHWESGARFQAGTGEIWNDALKRTIQQEAPYSFIICSDSCRIYALAPVLAQGQVAGLFAVGGSLAETVLMFQQTSSADLAIAIAAKPESSGTFGGDALLNRWGFIVDAMSSRMTSQPLFQAIAREIGLDEIKHSGRRLVIGGKVLEIAFLPLEQDNRTPNIRLLALEDITSHVKAADSAAWRALVLGLIAIACFLILLYVLVGRSLRRLTKTVAAIPLLGQGAFSQLRGQLRESEAEHPFFDEIDVLDRTAIMLSRRLESLEDDVVDRTQSLQRALSDVSKEKAFAASLLDHAQVIIVTCDGSGRVCTLNRYGCELGGYSESDVVNLPLVGSPLLENLTGDLNGRLLEVMSGRNEHLRHEATLLCRDGSRREISWVHTRLNSNQAGDVALLAVGLDITERKQNEMKLAVLADHDPLTGCFNRRRFHLELERMFTTTQRYHLKGALLYMDLDHFKYLNDTSGHQAGDNLLILVTEELRKLLRDSDIIGRLGGDEFAIAMLDADEAGAIGVAERINQMLTGISFPGLSINHRISASIGITLFPVEGMAVHDLLVNADIAMYQVKEGGRTGWHLFSPEEKAKEQMHEWMIWEERLKSGLTENRFELHFQPVMGIAGQSVKHYEVLLRLRTENGMLATPNQFLGVAERRGVIRALDRWVVRNSLMQLAALTGPKSDVVFSVNISGVSMTDTNMLDYMRQTFSETGVDPRRVIFEITETAAVADLSLAREFVNSVKELGSSFALDDFGSGFSSLYYLKQFPVDYVKIDGSFIRNLTDSLDDQIFVRAMVEFARAYGKQTIAEFVESDAILGLLRNYGVDYAQGYYIGKPEPYLLQTSNLKLTG